MTHFFLFFHSTKTPADAIFGAKPNTGLVLVLSGFSKPNEKPWRIPNIIQFTLLKPTPLPNKLFPNQSFSKRVSYSYSSSIVLYTVQQSLYPYTMTDFKQTTELISAEAMLWITKTMYLDPNHVICPNFDPDPSLFPQLQYQLKKIF